MTVEQNLFLLPVGFKDLFFPKLLYCSLVRVSKNKAVYTTAPVAGGWVGAVMIWAGAVMIFQNKYTHINFVMNIYPKPSNSPPPIPES